MKQYAKRLALSGYQLFSRLESPFDKFFLRKSVPTPNLVSHRNFKKHVYELGNKPGYRVLEIGSREVTGPSSARSALKEAEYIGFDFYPGPNVDIVGDVHQLSSYFGKFEQFDLIFSSACFEHFAMPWLVSVEIAKLLKVGGFLAIETHFSFGAHERPWNFFQFSDMALKTLFSSALGFDCIEAGMSNPMVGRFSAFADKYLRYRPVTGLYCHSEYLGRKIREVEGFDWKDVALSEVVAGTKYPKPKHE